MLNVLKNLRQQLFTAVKDKKKKLCEQVFQASLYEFKLGFYWHILLFF